MPSSLKISCYLDWKLPMTFKSKKVERSLLKKGFHAEPRDHWCYVFYLNGKRTRVKTHTSHCNQEINDYLINKMSKQVHLSKAEFIDLIECPLSAEEYELILLENGIIK